MKIEEIWVSPERDENLNEYLYKFNGAVPVAKIQSLILKKKIDDEHIYYGLFDNESLVGMLWITKYNETLYQSALVQLANQYRSFGYATFMYDFVVLNDKITLLSDNRQTRQSKNMWNHFRSIGHFQIKPYDLSTNKIVDISDINQMYDNNNMVWVGIPSGQTINESLKEINKKYQGMRYIVWYGPGTTSEDYFNY